MCLFYYYFCPHIIQQCRKNAVNETRNKDWDNTTQSTLGKLYVKCSLCLNVAEIAKKRTQCHLELVVTACRFVKESYILKGYL